LSHLNMPSLLTGSESLFITIINDHPSYRTDALRFFKCLFIISGRKK
jgi:hypothetical protein